ncbi:putative membrane protein YwzB [Sedimentibacter acidaminivorans]|uniref:Membrane protein YwzB n=1 Tax=Sedimentibacter acidaminivorans TaxID=913099 RepID=A0ABS4GBP6_9FIRM|nr:hypothetical protein [Sedimentibacter acidaminivorans]MBP1925102.1 putative membrane protein YwzB [Sedimentibacter acidaminivorans]
MKKTIVYWGISIIFFIINFKILGFIYDKFVPSNTITDIMVIFIIIFINIPLSVICTEKVFSIVREE